MEHHAQVDVAPLLSPVERNINGELTAAEPRKVGFVLPDSEAFGALPAITKAKLGIGKHFWSRIFMLLGAAFQTWKSTVFAFTLVLTVIAVATNVTHMYFVSVPKDLQSALKDGDKDMFVKSMITSIICVTILFIGNGSFKLISETTKALLRERLTKKIQQLYLSHKIYYKSLVLDRSIDNPDERVVRDVENWSENTYSIFTKLLNCGLSVALMTGVNSSTLGWWSLLPTGILLVGSAFCVIFMRRVVKRVFRQQLLEGDFRFAHMRVRDTAEALAFNGEEAERRELDALNQAIHRAVYNKITIFLGYYPIDLIKELLKDIGRVLGFIAVGAPYFFDPTFHSKADLGGLLTNVFATQTLMSNLTDIVNLVEDLGDVAGYTARVAEMLELIRLAQEDAVTGAAGVLLAPQKGDIYAFDGVCAETPNGKPLFTELTFALPKDEWLLISGPKGSGKSSILRLLAGLWHPKSGRIQQPGVQSIYYVPQRPYLGQAVGARKHADDRGMTFRELVTYPHPPRGSAEEDAEVITTLESAGGEQLLSRYSLSMKRDWVSVLSPGEQQTVIFARMLYHKPIHAILDEATASMDPKTEAQCYSKALELGIHIISVSHSSDLAKYHGAFLQLGQGKDGTQWSFENKSNPM